MMNVKESNPIRADTSKFISGVEVSVSTSRILARGKTKVKPNKGGAAACEKHQFYWKNGAPGETRTPDPLVRSQML